MSLFIHSTAPAAPTANLAPAAAVKSTSDTKSVAPSEKQAPSQAAVAAKAPQDTVQINTAAQTALQESKETQAQTAQEAAHGDRQAVKLLAKETAKKYLTDVAATDNSHAAGDPLDGVKGVQISPAIQQSRSCADSNLQLFDRMAARNVTKSKGSRHLLGFKSREQIIASVANPVYFW